MRFALRNVVMVRKGVCVRARRAIVQAIREARDPALGGSVTSGVADLHVDRPPHSDAVGRGSIRSEVDGERGQPSLLREAGRVALPAGKSC